MKLGTVVYGNQIYNLDGMSLDEMKLLLQNIENDKRESIRIAKDVIKNNE